MKQHKEPQYSKQAQKYIDKQDKVAKQRIKKAIEEIPKGNIVPYEENPPYLRLVVAGYRVIFKWISNEQIYILKIKPRGDVYKGA